MAKIELIQLFKSYGSKPVLRDISLEINDAEFMVFVGPSGCGKSSLLRSIAGFESLDRGRILIDGQLMNNVSPGKRRVAMVFQNYALYPQMTVAQNLSFCLRNVRTPRVEIASRVVAVAKLLQIETLLERKPHQLSGGQRQRVAIGRALIRNPKVYLFDEPLSNLDALLRTQTRIEISRLHRRFNTTTVYVTHDQLEAMTLADRIAVMNAGMIEQVGEPLELYHRPKNVFVASFLGSPQMNLIPGEMLSCSTAAAVIRISGGFTIKAARSAFALFPGDPVTVGIRPEHLQLSAKSTDPAAEVTAVERLGSRTLVYAVLRDPSGRSTPIIIDHPEQGPDTAINRAFPGEVINFSSADEHIHVFDGQGAALPHDTFSYARSA